MAGDEGSGAGRIGRRWAVFFALAVLGLFLVSCGGGEDGGDPDDAAHVNEESGSTNGLTPDARKGTPPPPVKETNLKVAAEKAGCYLYLDLDDAGHEHIPPESPAPKYKTNPSTSGDHVEPPNQQADGAYLEQPDPIDFVGSLEYGRMEIQYAPDLTEETQLELKGLYDTMYGATLLFPNTEMLYGVAATTWGNLLACTGWDGEKTLDAIRAFGKATWGKHGDEPVKTFGLSGPTPANPAEPKASK